MKPPWWLGLEPATGFVECGDGDSKHTIEWWAGRLRAVDHEDIEAEEALAVLGGARAGCLAVIDAWRRHATTVQLVTLGRRPAEGPIGYPSELAPKKLPSAAALRKAGERSDVDRWLLQGQEVLALLTLPGPMIDRLVLTAMASCAERWDDEAFRTEHGLRIGAALSARATPALRRFGERLGRGRPAVTVSPAQPGSGPSIVARLEEPDQPMTVTGELPVGWLVDVWGRGISEPGGGLVLAVREADEAGRELLVDLAEWEQAGPIMWELAARTARIVLDDDGRWTVSVLA